MNLTDIINLKQLGLGAIIGFLAKTLWDYLKLKITHRSEIEKISIKIYFEFAQKYYFRIFYCLDKFKDFIIKIHKNKNDTDTLGAFYYYLEFRRELKKFYDIAGVWFLTKEENEEKIISILEQINKVIPFDLMQKSYLDSFSTKNLKFELCDLSEILKNDSKLNEIYSIFNKWAKCECNIKDCKLLKLADALKEFSEVITRDLGSVFKEWYNLKRK